MNNISKYGAKKIIVDGIIFHSKMEADFYLELKHQKQLGNIVDFELQPKYELQPKFTKMGKNIRKIEYIADFLVTHIVDGVERQTVVDVKGFSKDSTFLIKKKMFDYCYQNIELVCITWYGRQWITVEQKNAIIRQNKKAKRGV